MIDNVRTGQNIAAFRQRLGWTQGELASRLNVTHQAVSKWENGVAFPDISTLYALSQLFGVSMELLLTGQPAAPENMSELPVQPETIQQITPPTKEIPAPEEPQIPSLPAADSAAYDWNEIIALAPFASRETLDRLADQCEINCDRGHILDLAPFLGRDTLDRLIRKSSDCADWDFITSLAPFASRDTLDALVSQCEADCDRTHITDLAPFVGRDTIDRLIRKSSDCADWDFITSLAPFASHETLDRLVQEALTTGENPRKYIQTLAPFLGRDTLDRLILGVVQSNAPDRHTGRADEPAAWSEALEKAFEQATHHAERIAAHMEENMLRQTGKLSDRIARDVEQSSSTAFAHAADTLRAFSSLPKKPSEDETSSHPNEHGTAPTDSRRTQIIDAVPDCPTLDAYADRIASLLYEALDPADPVIGRVEEIRQALLNQNFAALNEFAPLLDAHIGPHWLEEYASLCLDAEIPPDFEHQIDLAIAQHNWNWIEEHAHLITDQAIIRRIIAVSTAEGFFDFVALFAD